MNHMREESFDRALRTYLEETGMASREQVASALRAQQASLQGGTPLPLAEALVATGGLTAELRANVEKIVRSRQIAPRSLSHYTLLRKLGEGAMGEVYLAQDGRDGRKVAIKVLPHRFSDDTEFIARFRREAEAACRLKHPGIVEGYEIGLDQGCHFYAMEYCEGEPLDRIIARRGALPWARAVRVTLDIARSLEYAHSHGLVHRDIKPANIIHAGNESAKLLDLGLSKNVCDRNASFRTASGAVVGTPHYISPEQATGEKDLDGRADLYSLGATLYHLVTGATPFDGRTAVEIMYKQVHAQLPNPQDLIEDLPEGVVHVLRRMMAKDPRDRYADCGRCADDLEELLAGRVPRTEVLAPARSAVALARVHRAARKRTAKLRARSAAPSWNAGAITSAAGAVALLAFLALILVKSRGTEEMTGANRGVRAPIVERPPAFSPSKGTAENPSPKPDKSPLFDGKSLDWIVPKDRAAWRIKEGAMVPVSPGHFIFSTQQEFANGELVLQFECQGMLYAWADARLTDDGKWRAGFDQSVLGSLGPGRHELIVNCADDRVTAFLDGHPNVASLIHTPGMPPPKSGKYRFEGDAHVIRICSVEYRPLR